MLEEIKKLVKLQNIESEISIITKILNDAPQKLYEFDLKLNESEKLVENEVNTLNDLKKKYRLYESDLKTNGASVAKSQDRLSSIKTNKEYQAILKEIDDIKSKNSLLEDEMIAYLDNIESSEKIISSKNIEIKGLKSQFEKEKEKVLKEVNEGKIKLENLNCEWEKISKLVELKLFKKYKAIREQVKGAPPVAEVRASVCMGCHLNIPPQMYNELQRDKNFKMCPHCQRIIYWKAQE